MKTVKKIVNVFFRVLPHLNFALAICFITFYVVDRFNRPMAFINNEITKGMLVAFAVSLFVIKFLMEYIRKHDFKVFGWYRIALGIVVIIYFAARMIIA